MALQTAGTGEIRKVFDAFSAIPANLVCVLLFVFHRNYSLCQNLHSVNSYLPETRNSICFRINKLYFFHRIAYTFRKMARPSIFSDELADRICTAISEGSNLNKLCELDEFPTQDTVYRWLLKHAAFSENYARARMTRASVRADRIDDYCKRVIAGELDANQARVIIDAEKWQAAHEAPKVYGDALRMQHSDPNGEPLKIEVVRVGRPAKRGES